jgi:hypothetical protein
MTHLAIPPAQGEKTAIANPAMTVRFERRKKGIRGCLAPYFSQKTKEIAQTTPNTRRQID